MSAIEFLATDIACYLNASDSRGTCERLGETITGLRPGDYKGGNIVCLHIKQLVLALLTNQVTLRLCV